MKIVYVVHEFFPKYYTGTARVALNIAKQMQRMGHQVSVLTYAIDETEELKPLGNLLYKRYEYDSVRVIAFRHKRVNPVINIDIFYDDTEAEIRELIEAEGLSKPDIVHIVHPLRTAILAKIYKERGMPILMTLTDYWTICPKVQLLKTNYLLCNGIDEQHKCSESCAYPAEQIEKRAKQTEKLFAYADQITVPSGLVKHVFEMNNLGEKVRVVNHGLDYKYFKKTNNKKYCEKDKITFAYIGPVFRHKGVDLLIESFTKTTPKNITLRIYGSAFHETGYYDELKKKASCDGRISFMGGFNHDTLSDILNDIDIAVFPSIWYETYCLALAEALAHRVPVITSNTVGSGLEFIKDGVNGFIFDFRDPTKLTKIIDRIGEDTYILNELKENISYPVRIEEEAFTYENMYKELIKARD
jgi:glycosyltransferase involved in cell wall biosynthesis